ncbi:MAG: molecular chaperone [Candidatus Poribacteria bacterium]
MYQEQYETAISRSNIYQFIARFFTKAPDEEFVTKVLQKETLDGIATIFSEETALELIDFKAEFGKTVSLKQLACEYWALFDVPGKQYLAPYESVYRRDSLNSKGQPVGLVYGPSTYEVIQAYQQAGVKVAPEFLDLPDHVGMELEFLRVLCEKEAEAWQAEKAEVARKYLNWQHDFLQQHLSTWVYTLCDKMMTLASSAFYRAAARMAEEYITLERKNLSE